MLVLNHSFRFKWKISKTVSFEHIICICFADYWLTLCGAFLRMKRGKKGSNKKRVWLYICTGKVFECNSMFYLAIRSNLRCRGENYGKIEYKNICHTHSHVHSRTHTHSPNLFNKYTVWLIYAIVLHSFRQSTPFFRWRLNIKPPTGNQVDINCRAHLHTTHYFAKCSSLFPLISTKKLVRVMFIE